MKRGTKIYFNLAIVFIVSVLVSALIKGKGTLTFTETLLFGFLVVSSFVFSMTIAFSIANRHSRLSDLRSALREEDAILLNLYYLAQNFGSNVLKEAREKIDELLISELDFELEDFAWGSSKKLKEMHVFFSGLETKNEIQKNAKDKILDNLENILKIHKQVGYQIANNMMFYEWISLLSLASIIVFCLFYVNDGSVISIIITSIITASLALLILVLKELDSLKWQEQNWIWQPLSQLFLELDLVPYIPEGVLQEKRLQLRDLKGLKDIRIAHYPHPYPDMNDKKIQIVKL